MTEGRNLERHPTATQEKASEVNPEFNIESVLEKGEIVSVERLEGYFPIKVVHIKDDGQAMFRETSDEFGQGYNQKRFLRSELELIAARIDKMLRFGLVPSVANREVEGKRGILQERINAEIAAKVTDWEYFVDDLWLAKAAIFDYLTGNHDRHTGNFLIDMNTGRIWLIGHDYLALVSGGSGRKQILDKAKDKNLVQLSEDTKKSLKFLLVDIDSLKSETDDIEIIDFLEGVKTRTQALLNTGTLP